MNRIGISALCAWKQLGGTSLRKVTAFPGLSINGSKKMIYGDITCFAKYISTWNKPTYAFYSQDSRHMKRPTVQLIADRKTNKYKLVEKPIQLSAEQIKALFYRKVEEPIGLISQDKYSHSKLPSTEEPIALISQDKYSYHKLPPDPEPKLKPASKMLASTPITTETIDDASMLKSEPPKMDNAQTESETFLHVKNAYEFPKESAPKVFDSILEKELGEETMKFQNIANEKQAAKNSWNTVKYAFFIIGTSIIGIIIGSIVYIGAPKMDGDEVVDDMYSDMPIVLQYVYRTIDELYNFNKLIKDPSREKLLPDVLKPPYYQPPYTLVLEFTDILVHPEWTYSTGWRFKKRPGLDQFLEALYARFEVVVYTAEMGMTVFPIIEAIDKNNLISYKLVRDATKFMDGHHVKDLDKLNRELSKVIVIDWNPESTQLHQENLFRIPRWKGNDDDRTLFDLTALLMAISEWRVEDVRSVLKYYSEFEDPLASFRERQKLLAAQDR